MKMLLAIDCGNTQLLAGVFAGEKLLATWRVSTESRRTEDEYAVIFASLLQNEGLALKDISGLAAASVVPPALPALRRFAQKYLQTAAFIVDHNTPSGIALLVDNPAQVGPDRIVNALAGYAAYGGPLIVVDFGTATTFDCVSAAGEYLGGAIAPGVDTASEALFAKAVRLSSVDIYQPELAIGKNTEDSLRSGIMWGFAGQVDGVVAKLKEELGPETKVVATGGLAERVAPFSSSIEKTDPFLTLTGLRLIYEKANPGK